MVVDGGNLLGGQYISEDPLHGGVARELIRKPRPLAVNNVARFVSLRSVQFSSVQLGRRSAMHSCTTHRIDGMGPDSLTPLRGGYVRNHEPAPSVNGGRFGYIQGSAVHPSSINHDRDPLSPT